MPIVAAYELVSIPAYRRCDLENVAARETSDSIVTIEKSRAAREELEKSVVALRDAADLARARYSGGLSSYLDILITDQNLFAAELQLAEMRGTEFTAMVNLYRALGGGWQIAEQPATKP